MNSHNIIDLEGNLIKLVSQKQVYEQTFEQVVSGFGDKLRAFNPIEGSFSVQKYFNEGGISACTKMLIKDNIIESGWLRKYTTKKGKTKTDFKGLYIFLHEKNPIYVGISRGVISRIIQHLRGHSHNTSTLAYNIGLIRYELISGNKYMGGRKSFDFKSDVTPAKEFLIKQRLAFLPISSDEELYLFEIFCAMKFQCWLNKFETH